MVTWNNLDTLASFQELSKVERVNLVEAMSGENGADRVKNYSVPMAGGFSYNYAAKQVDDKVLAALVKLAEEAQLAEKFEALYNGVDHLMLGRDFGGLFLHAGEEQQVQRHPGQGQQADAPVPEQDTQQHDGGVDEPAQDGDQHHGPGALHLVQDGGGDAGEFP